MVTYHSVDAKFLMPRLLHKVLSKDARVRSAAEEAVSALLYAHVRLPTTILMLLFGMERPRAATHKITIVYCYVRALPAIRMLFFHT